MRDVHQEGDPAGAPVHGAVTQRAMADSIIAESRRTPGWMDYDHGRHQNSQDDEEEEVEAWADDDDTPHAGAAIPSSELVKVYTHATIWKATATCSRLRIWLLKYWAEYHAFRLTQTIREMNKRRDEWLRLELEELSKTFQKGGEGLSEKEREM